MAVLAAATPAVIATGTPAVPKAVASAMEIEVPKLLTAKSPVMVKTSPLMVVTERGWLIETAATATIAPATPAKATIIKIRYAGTCLREMFVFFKPRCMLLYLGKVRLTDKWFMKSKSILESPRLFAKLSVKLLQEIVS